MEIQETDWAGALRTHQGSRSNGAKDKEISVFLAVIWIHMPYVNVCLRVFFEDTLKFYEYISSESR